MNQSSFYKMPGTNISLLAARENIDFFDSQSVVLPRALTPLQAWGIILSHPAPLLKFSFRVRDVISSWFGVEQIGGFSSEMRKNLQVGEHLDFFLIEQISSDNLTLTNRDKHLDVMTCVSTYQNELTITSSVKTHNTFGRLYMMPVAPAHKLIVQKNLAYIKAELSKENL